jgi:HD-GYP domain-containing protein (c-di-GMP phosphodiesterase class II)
VADVFEALTARDRPYKPPMKLSQALKILGFMCKDKHIDPEVYALLQESGLVRQYAEEFLNPDQLDLPLHEASAQQGQGGAAPAGAPGVEGTAPPK